MEFYNYKIPVQRRKSDVVSLEIKRRRRERYRRLCKADRRFVRKWKLMENYDKRMIQTVLDLPV